MVPETKVCGVSVVLSRTGFTGELGFDIYVSTDDGERLFRGLWETGRDLGMKAIGLAMVSADASEQGERLTVERGDRKSDVELVALPFVDPERKLPKV